MNEKRIKITVYDVDKNATRDFKTYSDEDGNVPLNVDFNDIIRNLIDEDNE